jgi:hypothetical protein
MSDSKRFFQIVFISFCVFFLSWLFVYKTDINKLAIQSEDTLPAVFLPVAIIKEKTLYLNSYYNMMIERYPHPDDKDQVRGLTPFYLKKIDNNYASAFTIITPLISLPVYFLPLKLGIPVTWENLIILSKISSSLIMALAGGFLYLLLKKQFSLDEKKALILTTIYLFGTVNFAMLSQSMWQHGTLQLFSILGLYFILDLVKSPNFKPFSAFLGGLFYGLAVLSRPTVALALGLVGLFMLFKMGNFKSFFKAGFFTMLGLLLNVAFFLWYNNKYYIGIENQGYTSQLFGSWVSPFPISFIGTWISPSKGILTYSPIFLFSFVGFYLAMKKGWKENVQFIFYFLIVILHTLIMSFWKHWYGGYSFGYRMSSDIIPYLIILMVPFIKSQSFDKNKIVFWILFYISIFMQVFGIIFFDGIWHAAYDTGFKNTSWLWSVKDSELMFNIRRIMVKLKILQSACPKCLPLE